MNFKKYQQLTDLNSTLDSKQQALLLDDMRNEYLLATGLNCHPKGDELLAKAFKEAHKYGPEEVFNHLDDLANLELSLVDLKYKQ